MKILILSPNLKGVGTYLRSFYFGRELARRGHEVTMIAVSRDSKYRPRISYKRDWIGESDRPVGDGSWVRMIEAPRLGHAWLPGWGSGPLDIWLRIREILRGDYDAVYGFEYHPNVSWPVYLTRPLGQYRFYSDWCDWYAGSANRLRGWKIAHKVDAIREERIRLKATKVSVISQVLGARAASIGVPRERIIYLPNGAPTEYIQPMTQGSMRERFGLSPDIPVLAAVRDGDMHGEVSIFAHVLKRSPHAFFLMIGRPATTALELASRLGIREHVVSTGWVSDEDYPCYLACADVCFLPLTDGLNDRARWPAKILDFLCAGRATVTNDVGEVGGLFRQREVGVLAGHSQEEFAESIAKLLECEEQRRYLGCNARRLMVAEWDWKLRGEQIAEVVEGP